MKWTDKAPFHVATLHVDRVFAGYEILCKNRPFLRQPNVINPANAAPRMKRQQAYAIARLLNGETTMRKWADKFGDPYL